MSFDGLLSSSREIFHLLYKPLQEKRLSWTNNLDVVVFMLQCQEVLIQSFFLFCFLFECEFCFSYMNFSVNAVKFERVMERKICV